MTASNATAPNAILSELMLSRDMGVRALVKAAAELGHKLSPGQASMLASGKAGFGLDSARACAAVFAVPAVTFMPELAEFTAAVDPHHRRIPLAALKLSPENERKTYLEEGIIALAGDVVARGILQNLVVWPDPDNADEYFVYAGGRRWRAARLAATWGQLPDELASLGIPCRVLADRQACLLATIAENAQREDVHFVERAAALANLRAEFGWKAPRIAAETNLGERYVQQLLQVHDKLDDGAKELALKGHLTWHQAREAVQEKKAPAPIIEPPAPPALPAIEPALPLALPKFHMTAAEADTAFRALATTPRTEEPVSERIRRVVLACGDFQPSELTRVTAVNFLAVRRDIEREFAIELSAEDAQRIDTIGAMTRHVIALMGQPKAPPPPIAAAPAPPPAEPGSPKPGKVSGDLRAHNDKARRIIRRILKGGLDGDIDDLAFTIGGKCRPTPEDIIRVSEAFDFLTPELWSHLQWFDENSDLPDEEAEQPTTGQDGGWNHTVVRPVPNATRWNFSVYWPPNGAVPKEITLINIDSGAEVLFVPAQRDLED